VNTSNAIVKTYNNDELPKADQLLGLDFQRTLDPRLTLHPRVETLYTDTRIPFKTFPLGTTITPLFAMRNTATSKPDSNEETVQRTDLSEQQLHDIFDSSSESSPHSSRRTYSPTLPLCNTRNYRQRSIKIPRPSKNANSYRAWPSYRQAIVDRDRNAALKLEEARKDYEAKRSEDIKEKSDLFDQLSRTIANHNLQIDSLTPPLALLSATLHQREADLAVKAKQITKRDAKLSRDEETVSNWRDRLLYPATYHHVTQTDRLSRICVLAGDIVRQQHHLDTPYTAFLLHRRIAPALAQLTASLGKTDENLVGIWPDDRAIKYYSQQVQDIQYDLRDSEWAEFKDTPTKYEATDLPSNPGTDEDDDEFNGW
jgi:hypothetical protein